MKTARCIIAQVVRTRIGELAIRLLADAGTDRINVAISTGRAAELHRDLGTLLDRLRREGTEGAALKGLPGGPEASGAMPRRAQLKSGKSNS